MFDQIGYAEFEADATVVHHELGHAFVWLSDGGIVDQIRFWRTHSGLLAGAMRQGLPPTRPGESTENLLMRMWHEHSVEYARRLLAGEVAARKLLALPENQITCEFPITRDSALAALLPEMNPDSSDIIKALHIAHDAAGEDWYLWIAERHTEAKRKIEASWRRLASFASDVLSRLPSHAEDELIILGREVTVAFSETTASMPSDVES